MIKQKRTMLVFNLIVLSVIMSCNPESHSESCIKNELFNVCFNNEASLFPKSDPYNGFFVLNKTDTFFYNIGYNLSNLSEESKQVVYTKDSVELLNTSNEIYYVSEKHFDTDKLRERNIEYFSSNGCRIKLIYPIDTLNRGLVGIYSDSILSSRLGNIQMNIFSYKLNSTSYKLVRESLLRIQLFDWDTGRVKIPLGTYYTN